MTLASCWPREEAKPEEAIKLRGFKTRSLSETQRYESMNPGGSRFCAVRRIVYGETPQASKSEVEHPLFDVFFAFVVILNSILIGIDVESWL